MAGKSTFLRQNALISIMAQAGLFVPATYAELGVVDQIFSRASFLHHPPTPLIIHSLSFPPLHTFVYHEEYLNPLP
jgi:hypothetical protein